MSAASPHGVTPATTASAPTRTARREATRSRLCTAATEVFAERGFHGASVEDICARAGFTRGAFYSNFASKDALVLELYAQHIARLEERVRALSARADTRPEDLLEGVFGVWSEMPREQEQWYLLQVEFQLHAIRDPAANRAWASQQAQVRASLAGLVARMAEEHGLALSVTPEEFVRLGLAIYHGAMAQHLLEPERLARGELERRFLPLVLRAVTRDS